jgi:ABC-type phosphate transport system substrate-binding protein
MTATPPDRMMTLWCALALAAVVAMPTVLPAQSSGRDVAIVVHPETPVDTMTLAEVRKVFRGERQYWTPSNIPVVLLVRAPVSRERDVVLRVIYQMSEPQFKQYWIARIFRAEATSGPKIVYSNDVANQLAGAIPGAVGFMPAAEVKPPLKILRVDGKLPGEPGYLIR